MRSSSADSPGNPDASPSRRPATAAAVGRGPNRAPSAPRVRAAVCREPVVARVVVAGARGHSPGGPQVETCQVVGQIPHRVAHIVFVEASGQSTDWVGISERALARAQQHCAGSVDPIAATSPDRASDMTSWTPGQATGNQSVLLQRTGAASIPCGAAIAVILSVNSLAGTHQDHAVAVLHHDATPPTSGDSRTTSRGRSRPVILYLRGWAEGLADPQVETDRRSRVATRRRRHHPVGCSPSHVRGSTMSLYTSSVS
jgi:hypothetical protein